MDCKLMTAGKTHRDRISHCTDHTDVAGEKFMHCGANTYIPADIHGEG